MNNLRRFLFIAAVVFNCLCVDATADPGAGRQESMHAEKKFTLKLETTRHKQYCQAKIQVEYAQRNTTASISGTIENRDCGASGGNYTLSVRFRDEHGEIQTIEREEQWQRENDETFAFEKEYSIGENVDLVRVRARKVVCVCAEMAAAGEDEAIKGEDE